MQNKNKWLMLGGGVLVIAALGLAVVLNQGGLFKGSIQGISGFNQAPAAAVVPDFASKLAASGQKPDTILFTVGNRDIMGDSTLLTAGVFSVSNGELTFDGQAAAKDPAFQGVLYFKTQEHAAVPPVELNLNNITRPSTTPATNFNLELAPTTPAAGTTTTTTTTTTTPAIALPAAPSAAITLPLAPIAAPLAAPVATNVSAPGPTATPTRTISPTILLAPRASLIHHAHAAIPNPIKVFKDINNIWTPPSVGYPNGTYTVNVYNYPAMPEVLDTTFTEHIIGNTCSDIDQIGFNPTKIVYDKTNPSGLVTVSFFGIDNGSPVYKPGTSDYLPLFPVIPLNKTFCIQSLTNLVPLATIKLVQSDDPSKFISAPLTELTQYIFPGANFTDSFTTNTFKLDPPNLAGGTIGNNANGWKVEDGKTYNFSLEGPNPGASQPIAITLTKGAVPAICKQLIAIFMDGAIAITKDAMVAGKPYTISIDQVASQPITNYSIKLNNPAGPGAYGKLVPVLGNPLGCSVITGAAGSIGTPSTPVFCKYLFTPNANDDIVIAADPNNGVAACSIEQVIHDIGIGATIFASPAANPNLLAGAANPDLLGVSFRNVSIVNQTITSLTYTGLISTDGGITYSPASSAGTAIKDIVSDYKTKGDAIVVDPGSASSMIVKSIDPITGDITFPGLNYTIAAGKTGIIKLSSPLVSASFTSAKDILFKYVLKDYTLADPLVGKMNTASTNNGIVMTIKGIPPVPTNMDINPSGADQPLKPNDSNVNMLTLDLTSTIVALPIEITSITFGSSIKGDAIGDFESGHDVSANVYAGDMVHNLYLEQDPAKAKSNLDGNGEVTFSGLSVHVPLGTNLALLKLDAEHVNGINENGRKALQNDTQFKFFVKAITFSSAAVIPANKADASSSSLPVMTEKMDCIAFDKFVFTPSKLTYDENTPKSPQYADLAAYSGTTDLGMPMDGACTASLVNSNLGDKVQALYLELNDASTLTKIVSDTILINGSIPFPATTLEKYVTINLVDAATGTPVDLSKPLPPGKLYLRFATGVDKKDFTLAGKSLEYNKLYNLVLYGTTKIAPNKPVTVSNVQKNALPVASYQIILLPKAGAPVVPPVVPPTGNTYITNNTYTTTTTPTPAAVTPPSAEPCIVNGKTFYLADGPNSSYCKDLQQAGVINVDQPASTEGVRYVTALTALRVLKDLGATIRTRNLPSDWFTRFADDFNRTASASELADFRTVYATGILTGRVDPRDSSIITLAPLDQVSFAELLSLYEHTIVNGLGVAVQYDANNVPGDILQEYQNNPDWKWIAEAYSFGVKYKMITKNQFTKETIFNITNKGDLADFIARFKTAVAADPSLLVNK